MNDDAAWARLAAGRVGRFATSAPRIVPVTFAVVGSAIVHAVDHKPKATRALARVEDIRRDPRASLLVDHYDEDWSRLWWIRIRGRAEVHREHDEVAVAVVAALATKYTQYRERPPADAVYRIAIDDIRSWRPPDNA